MTLTTTGASLLNAGVMGFLTWGYVVAVGGSLNGPVLGGIFTAIGFATFGKHPRNSLPIVVVVVVACLAFGKDLAAPGPLLAALFGLTLAPLAGEFGWVTGVIAGFLHLIMVGRAERGSGVPDRMQRPRSLREVRSETDRFPPSSHQRDCSLCPGQ